MVGGVIVLYKGGFLLLILCRHQYFSLQEPLMNQNPRIVLHGVEDASVPKRTPVPETNPIHFPWLFIQAATGPDVAFVSPEDKTALFGEETFNARGKFFNHQTQLLEMLLEEGNTCLVTRITRPHVGVGDVITNVPKKANFLVLCQIDTSTVVKPYIRNSDGTIAKDAFGAPRLHTASMANPMTLKFYVVPASTFTPSELATAFSATGGDVTYNSKSTYPLMMFEHSFVGKPGENTGIRLWSANNSSPTPADKDIITHQQAVLYAAQLVTRKDALTSPTISTSLLGETYIEFGMNEGVYNYKTNKDLKLGSLVENWNDDGSVSGLMPIWGPLGKVQSSQANLDTILDLIAAAEVLAITEAEDLATVIVDTVTLGVDDLPIPEIAVTGAVPPASKYMYDILSGVNYEGVPFYSFRVSSTTATFGSTRTHYLLDGHDGDLTVATYESAIVNHCDNLYNDPKYPMISSAKYPWSALYDTGFGNDVKQSLFGWMGKRKNIHVTAGTYVVGEAALSAADEVSAGNTLRSYAMGYAESSVYGTPACRAVLFRQSGFLINRKFKGRVPIGVFELAIKRARSLGASNGIVVEGSSYNQAPGNVLELSKDVTCQYLDPSVEALLWANGLNAATAFNRSSLFYPSIQTVFGVQESVLIGEFYMQVICDIETQIEKTWRYMVNSDSPPATFVADSNAVFNAFVKGKYDNRVVVTPNTFFTPLDTERGFTWQMEVEVAGSVPKTVAFASIKATRILEV